MESELHDELEKYEEILIKENENEMKKFEEKLNELKIEFLIKQKREMEELKQKQKIKLVEFRQNNDKEFRRKMAEKKENLRKEFLKKIEEERRNELKNINSTNNNENNHQILPNSHRKKRFVLGPIAAGIFTFFTYNFVRRFALRVAIKNVNIWLFLKRCFMASMSAKTLKCKIPERFVEEQKFLLEVLKIILQNLTEKASLFP